MSRLAVRKLFPYIALAMVAIALLYATSFGTLPRADLTFNNNTEIQTVDPPKATGVPEGRVIDGLFEGLLRRLPVPAAPPGSNRESTPFSAQLATADQMEVSENGRNYTFHIRETARWSDGSPVTADDFAWSWLRMLHPETASQYAYQLYYIVGAQNYFEAILTLDEPVEVELNDRPHRIQTFPRGTILHGKLLETLKPTELTDPKEISQGTIHVVDIAGKKRAFCRDAAAGRKWYLGSHQLEQALYVLPDFEKTVGVKALGTNTLEITLKERTPYFPDLLAFYPLYPTNRKCVEKFGSPDFTQPENLVCNGAYKLQFRRIRDRVRLVKNPHYWNADQVALQTIDAMAISSDIAGLNMYETGQVDWLTNVPPTVIPELRERTDFHSAPMLTTYFYRVNCTRPPLDDKRIRRALSMTIEKQKICDKITRAGEVAAHCFVPPGLTGYVSPAGAEFNVEAARKLLAEAGFPNGQGLPKIEILYNTQETHQAIAEVIQEDWKKHLGIDIELRGLEWGTYLDHQQNLQYQICRAGWTADYPDPNTYIDMFVTGGANNQTGWSNAQYDSLVQQAAKEADSEKRLQLLAEAEAILLEEQPILPIYSYMAKNLVNPQLQGFHLNAQDIHPLHIMRMDRTISSQPGRMPLP